MGLPEFKAFASIPRLSQGCVITEKIDGTNGIVHVSEDGVVTAGSRTRWITPEDDNCGFARWVAEHADELRVGLGIGYHYGEWWGAGIQRRYGLTEKRFSLFNAGRWGVVAPAPACCHVVPKLHGGEFSSNAVASVMASLASGGSVAAPGFMNPEGIVLYHAGARQCFKKTFGGDGHKGGQASRAVLVPTAPTEAP